MVYIIYGGAPLERLQIQGRTLFHIVAHVSNVDAQDPAAPVVKGKRDGVVQVFGGGGVNGDHAETAEVGAVFGLGGGDSLRNGLGGEVHLGRKVGRDTIAEEDGGLGGLQGAVVGPLHRQHPGFGAAGVGDLDTHQVASGGAVGIRAGDEVVFFLAGDGDKAVALGGGVVDAGQDQRLGLEVFGPLGSVGLGPGAGIVGLGLGLAVHKRFLSFRQSLRE